MRERECVCSLKLIIFGTKIRISMTRCCFYIAGQKEKIETRTTTNEYKYKNKKRFSFYIFKCQLLEINK